MMITSAKCRPRNGAGRARLTISTYRKPRKLFATHPPNQLLARGSHDRALRQQSNGGFASADAPEGTTDASIQIRPSGTTVSFPSCRGPQSVPTRTPPNQIPELPILAIAILYDLANNDRGLRSTGNH